MNPGDLHAHFGLLTMMSDAARIESGAVNEPLPVTSEANKVRLPNHLKLRAQQLLEASGG